MPSWESRRTQTKDTGLAVPPGYSAVKSISNPTYLCGRLCQ